MKRKLVYLLLLAVAVYLLPAQLRKWALAVATAVTAGVLWDMHDNWQRNNGVYKEMNYGLFALVTGGLGVVAGYLCGAKGMALIGTGFGGILLVYIGGFCHSGSQPSGRAL